MSRALQYPTAVAGGILVVIIGLLVLVTGGPTYAMFGWLLIAVGGLSTAANVVVRRQHMNVPQKGPGSVTRPNSRAGSS